MSATTKLGKSIHKFLQYSRARPLKKAPIPKEIQPIAIPFPGNYTVTGLHLPRMEVKSEIVLDLSRKMEVSRKKKVW